MKNQLLLLALILLTLGLTTVALRAKRSPTPRPATLRELYQLPSASSISVRKTALILVDFQEEFFTGKLRLPNAAGAADSAKALLHWARSNAINVVHVHQIAIKPDSPVFAPNSPGVTVTPPLRPIGDEYVVVKSAGGAFTNTKLHSWLTEHNIDTLIVAGLMTHLAIQLTACDATVHGYQVMVAADATATRELPLPGRDKTIDHQLVQQAMLAGISDRFASVLATKKILALPLIP